MRLWRQWARPCDSWCPSDPSHEVSPRLFCDSWGVRSPAFPCDEGGEGRGAGGSSWRFILKSHSHKIGVHSACAGVERALTLGGLGACGPRVLMSPAAGGCLGPSSSPQRSGCDCK